MIKTTLFLLLCVCSAAFGMAADWDLVATIVNDETILTNTGEDSIAVGTLGFTSADCRLVPVNDNWFSSYIGIPGNGFSSGCERTFITFGPLWIIDPGESWNLGQIAYHIDGDMWQQTFVDADPEPVYYFDLVPEPASVGLMSLGALAMLRRRSQV